MQIDSSSLAFIRLDLSRSIHAEHQLSPAAGGIRLKYLWPSPAFHFQSRLYFLIAFSVPSHFLNELNGHTIIRFLLILGFSSGLLDRFRFRRRPALFRLLPWPQIH